MAQRGRPGLSPSRSGSCGRAGRRGVAERDRPGAGQAAGLDPRRRRLQRRVRAGRAPALSAGAYDQRTGGDGRGLAEGASLRRIAGRLQRAPSSISRESPATAAAPGTGRRGRRTGVGPGPPPEALQARRGATAPGAGGRQARRSGRPSRSRDGLLGPTLASRIFRCRPDDLPQPVRPGPWRSPQGAHRAPADPAHHAALAPGDQERTGPRWHRRRPVHPGAPCRGL